MDSPQDEAELNQITSPQEAPDDAHDGFSFKKIFKSLKKREEASKLENNDSLSDQCERPNGVASNGDNGCVKMDEKSNSNSDRTDAWPFQLKKSNGPPIAKAPKGFTSMSYNMKHERRGDCVIINNNRFQPHLQLNQRHGTIRDAINLERRFQELGFTVHVAEDQSRKEMLDIVELFAKEVNHSAADCFVMIVLSHGDESGIYATDAKISSESLYEPFKGDQCLSLAGKPKIFITQACRGDKLDSGVDMVFEEEKDAAVFQRIPREADFLYAFSTVPGYYSWRNTQNGSWYIQCLCHELVDNAHNPNLEFIRLLTRVTRRVSYLFESNIPNYQDMHKKKQVPSIVSTLTKDLYLCSKALTDVEME